MEVNRRICDELTLNVLSIELQLVNVDYGAKLYAYAFHSRKTFNKQYSVKKYLYSIIKSLNINRVHTLTKLVINIVNNKKKR